MATSQLYSSRKLRLRKTKVKGCGPRLGLVGQWSAHDDGHICKCTQGCQGHLQLWHIDPSCYTDTLQGCSGYWPWWCGCTVPIRRCHWSYIPPQMTRCFDELTSELPPHETLMSGPWLPAKGPGSEEPQWRSVPTSWIPTTSFLCTFSFIDFYKGQDIKNDEQVSSSQLKTWMVLFFLVRWIFFFFFFFVVTAWEALLLLLCQKPNHQDQFNQCNVLYVWECRTQKNTMKTWMKWNEFFPLPLQTELTTTFF